MKVGGGRGGGEGGVEAHQAATQTRAPLDRLSHDDGAIMSLNQHSLNIPRSTNAPRLRPTPLSGPAPPPPPARSLAVDQLRGHLRRVMQSTRLSPDGRTDGRWLQPLINPIT